MRLAPLLTALVVIGMVIWFTSFAPKGGLTVSSDSHPRQESATDSRAGLAALSPAASAASDALLDGRAWHSPS